MANGWLRRLVFSLATFFLIQVIFSYWIQMGMWVGLGVFLILFIGAVAYGRGWMSGRKDTERLEEYAQRKREQQYINEEETNL